VNSPSATSRPSVSARRHAPSPEGRESLGTILLAFGINLAIAVGKLGTALISGSSALLAESAHSFADAGNSVILLVADRRGARPSDRAHPLGHGREAYFWALLASVGVFLAGGALSVLEGIRALLRPEPIDSYVLAYVVLTVSLVLESISLWRAHRQLRDEAGDLSRDLLEHVSLTSDPVTRAVFFEDSAAVVGNVIAIAGLALHQITGSPIPDAIAAIVIGAGLAVVAYELAGRNHDFLVGEKAPEDFRNRIREVVAGHEGVEGVPELLTMFLGPRKVHVLGRVELADALSGPQVEALLRTIERDVRDASEVVTRVDLVPTG
jgi:cation diffusion facilitator family transporter